MLITLNSQEFQGATEGSHLAEGEYREAGRGLLRMNGETVLSEQPSRLVGPLLLIQRGELSEGAVFR